MSFFDVIGTILPTIGGILGELLTGKKTELDSKAVTYSFGDDFKCGFTKDRDGQHILVNTSLDDRNIITLGVPAIGDMAAETITVPENSQASVNEIFERCAANDSTKLMLSGCSVNDVARKNGSNDVFHIAAGGYNIPVDGVTSKRIGSYLTIICSQDKAVIKSLRTIHCVTSATFRGRSDSSVTVTNVNAIAEGSGSKVEIPFAKSFPEGTYLDIDVEVDMGELQKILAEQHVKVTRASEENVSAIRNAARQKNRNLYDKGRN